LSNAAATSCWNGVAARHDQGPAEIQRAQFGERESRVVQTAERLGFEPPVALAVDHLVEQRKPRRLQRFEVAPDGPGGDAGAFGEIVNRQPSRGFEIPQDRPLPDDFGVPRHRSDDGRGVGAARDQTTALAGVTHGPQAVSRPHQSKRRRRQRRP
jgi:hypothetical protein